MKSDCAGSINRLGVALAALLSVGLPYRSSVAADDASGPGTQNAIGLEEIIVTARRREEDVQKVPIAVTVVSPDAIRDNNITTLQDVQQLVPSLTVTTGNVGQRDSANVTIRGQGWGSFGQPAVAQYLNEVPLPTDFNSVLAGGPGLFFDLENIQVLKGPQGTLFGRNTMGGAVLLQSARPTNEFGGRIQVTYGNYNDREVDGEINLPLANDVLLARIAFNGQVRDGFTYVQSMPGYPNGIDLDNRDTKSIRGTLSFRPASGFQNDLILTYQKYLSHGSADFVTSVTPNGTVTSVYGPIAAQYLAEQEALGPRVHIPIDVDLNGTGGQLFALQNITKIDFNDQLTFRNIFGLDKAIFEERSDLFGTPLPIFDDIYDHDPVQQFTDEMQLLGKNFGDRLDWVAGAFWSYQSPPDKSYFSPLTLRILLPAGTPPDVNNDVAQRRLILASKAVFAQGTYDLSDLVNGLKITAGVRNTWDDQQNSSKSAAGVISSADGPSSAPTYTAAVDYQATPDTSLYFTSRRGYRSGGAAVAPNGVLFPYDPEYVRDFELGTKSDWHISDTVIRTNADVYYQNYTNIQVNELIAYPGSPGGLNITANAASARLWGAELEMLAVLTKNFEVGANFAYLSFKYKDFGPGVDPTGLIAGETANRIPRQYGVNGRYRLPLASDMGEMSLRANWHWQAAFGDFLGNDTIPAYGLLNASLDWNSIMRSPVDAQLFVSNALNKQYYSGGIGFLGISEATYGDPRLYGIRLAYRFGAQGR